MAPVTRNSSRIAAAALAASALLAWTGFASAVFASGTQSTTTSNTSGNQGGNGGGNQGGSQGNNGGGTATPELPSGVLFGIGLIPLAVGVLWLRRRDRSSADSGR